MLLSSWKQAKERTIAVVVLKSYVDAIGNDRGSFSVAKFHNSLNGSESPFCPVYLTGELLELALPNPL